ncbi:glycine dehydrogenase [Rhizoclosmatium globosum]|uniref:Glycine cleavage system P protein n=1 Tax=Rhizoclosmatium globosum TaxID=329046 RepID=A0A1Y2C8X1_9FUNG|nr:glycine dehydrogenase [Rhizoclosmatium globosum]|eukprot:ORY43386.1 glycine dehydrogenase [Rhizoclosmatium globosum]
MLKLVGLSSLDALSAKALPESIHIQHKTRLGPGMPEKEVLERLRYIASQNKILKSYIGMGYASAITPPVILRNIMENPAWYTQYTPYQPEIAQGRLESLINYQTMIQDFTGLDIANASLLDEGTAAGEAMLMCYSAFNRKRNIFFVDERTFPQTIAVLKTRAEGFGIEVIVGDYEKFNAAEYKDSLMGVLLQYPNSEGSLVDYASFTKSVHENGGLVTVATDLLACALVKPPGEWGADIAFGNSQRFGVPLGYGGPHAAFFAVKDEHKRRMPGRLIGVSKDANGKTAYRLALQTREQHIRREKATSNICTAQALLANMAAMYAVYHGPQGIKDIAQRVHNLTSALAAGVEQLGHKVVNKDFFDTLTIKVNVDAAIIHAASVEAGINLRRIDNSTVGVTLDETVSKDDLEALLKVFARGNFADQYKFGTTQPYTAPVPSIDALASSLSSGIPAALIRSSAFLTHKVFNSYHSETEMLRYIFALQHKDLSLADAMIPLGSCTMKLNATTEMIPVTWPEFGAIHPFVPIEQAKGYEIMHKELEYALQEATGFDSISLQPNSGAQGEYTGLRTIVSYLNSIGQSQRNICLIPVSAHGTNPASAAMCGLQVVVVKCEENGNLDLVDLRKKAEQYKDKLAAAMITYPSTYGVFEDTIVEACKIIHENGGQVYMDGANLNAQMGLCKPAEIGADVCHLNLHKTFCIPHGGGGPGMGPIGVKTHLAKFLPNHPVVPTSGPDGIGPVSAAPWGSASILPISWAYLKMMGDDGLRKATQVALLNANYMLKRLAGEYKILFTDANGFCAHEFILDTRVFGASSKVEAIDIAKRLHDYGFHSPTMSFPVPNTLMIEPTESESKAELDRFCDAMLKIREEIRAIEEGKQPKEGNVLKMAPHPIDVLTSDKWDRPYSRQDAAYPMAVLRKRKFWPTVSRVDDTYGDRNLICSCPPIEDYEN